MLALFLTARDKALSLQKSVLFFVYNHTHAGSGQCLFYKANSVSSFSGIPLLQLSRNNCDTGQHFRVFVLHRMIPHRSVGLYYLVRTHLAQPNFVLTFH